MEENLIKRFNQGFWGYLVFTILMLLLIVVIIVLRKKILGTKPEIYRKVIFIASIITILFVGLLWGLRFSQYACDYSNVRNKNFQMVSGTVIGYSRGTFYDNGSTEHYDPIILIDGTNNKIILSVFETKLNEHYTFIYLENTKIAEIYNE
jgi:hypothetical protein